MGRLGLRTHRTTEGVTHRSAEGEELAALGFQWCPGDAFGERFLPTGKFLICQKKKKKKRK